MLQKKFAPLPDELVQRVAAIPDEQQLVPLSIALLTAPANPTNGRLQRLSHKARMRTAHLFYFEVVLGGVVAEVARRGNLPAQSLDDRLFGARIYRLSEQRCWLTG